MRLVLIVIIIVSLLILLLTLMVKKSRSPEEARRRIDANMYDYILDVRTPEEWAEGHHPKATHLPLHRFVSDLPKMVPNKDARILIVCRRGIRSRAAAVMADDLGYTNVEWVSGLHNGLRGK